VITEPNLTKFLHDVESSSLLLMCSFASRYCNLFWNTRAIQRVKVVSFCQQKVPKINWLPQ